MSVDLRSQTLLFSMYLTQQWEAKCLTCYSFACTLFLHLLCVTLSGHRNLDGRVSHAFLSGLAQPTSIVGSHEKRPWNDRVWWVCTLLLPLLPLHSGKLIFPYPLCQNLKVFGEQYLGLHYHLIPHTISYQTTCRPWMYCIVCTGLVLEPHSIRIICSST